MRALIVGCGNASRRDDGAGLYVIRELVRRFGFPEGEPETALWEGDVPRPSASEPAHVELRFEQQLDITLAADLGGVDLWVVVDAHTGAYPEDLRRVEMEPGYSASMTSHHLTPDTILGLAVAMHSRTPRTVLFSIRGYDFNFGEEMTPQTRAAADQAVGEIVALVVEE